MAKQSIELSVEGMSCGHCVSAVEKSVGGLDGVDSVNVNLENKKVAVEFDGDKVSVQDIKDVIENQGYDVV